MNKLKQLVIGTAIAVMPFSAVALTVHAADLTSQLSDVNQTAGFGTKTPQETIGQLISVFLGVLGIVFLLLTIYAGFLWMTAAGDDKKVASAKNILISAVVGLVVILSAYAISSFVIQQLQTATT
ncbi:MAG: pilin [Patescibacteria group bacterium]|jgi:hypothetical protein